MENLIAWILMAAISLPISFLMARACLGGVMRLMSKEAVREAYPSDVLSSRA
jgi:hypothetical protein